MCGQTPSPEGSTREQKMIAKIKNKMKQEHDGAVAFEYMIILVVMAVVIFAAWGTLGTEIKEKATDVASFIANNGQTALGKN